MKRLLVSFFIASLCGFATTVFGTSNSGALITKVFCYINQTNEYCGIVLDKTNTGTFDSCVHTAHKNKYTFEVSSTPRSAAYSTALLAYSTGKTVHVSGTGLCDSHAVTEDLREIIIE